ncbi:hypothetical protein [Aeromicrobium sp.]|nr:hypothetical protein [Aeromicrobium sp.]MBC7633362.1 hypothetical protein [Aeromicrobium sp.]
MNAEVSEVTGAMAPGTPIAGPAVGLVAAPRSEPVPFRRPGQRVTR